MLDNPRSPKVRAVAKLAKKQRRHEAKLFLVEGPQAVREVLAYQPGRVVDIFLTSAVQDRYADIVALATENSIELTESSVAVIDQMSDTVSPQGIVAVVEFLEVEFEQVMAASPHLVAILHEVQDPGNVGNIIRTADAAGVDAVIVTNKSVDVFNPKVVRATTGSLFHLPVMWGLELEDVIDRVRSAGLQVLSTDATGEQLVALRASGQLEAPTAWLLGNEATGLSEEEKALGDRVVSVPLYGAAESLSLQTAAAVCLYESAFARPRNA